MNIIFFSHPIFLGSQSMYRYARWLSEGMKNRGHNTEIWSPPPNFYDLSVPRKLKKWMGYVDQYILFPSEVKKRIKQLSQDTLFVFTDHALGPWVPLAVDRAHIIHCHDFLAQQSAKEVVPENPVKWTGRKYQKYIRNGYRRGNNFISISEKTRADLHIFLGFEPKMSEVVYNGLTQDFSPSASKEALRKQLKKAVNINLSQGYLLHVGGNQWYKNRKGIIEIYNAWRGLSKNSLPLLLVGESADEMLRKEHEASSFKNDIHFLVNTSDDLVRDLYAGASVFVFPSLAEGFGYPIAESMASGTPVITTNEAPMTEVAGDSAYYISRRPSSEQSKIHAWANEAAEVLNQSLSSLKNEAVINKGFQNVKRFNSDKALDQIERIYFEIIRNTNI